MKDRLRDIIKYKTGGRQNEFAAMMGWTPVYLAKLIRGNNFGLTPVLTLLEKLPEISARWLLLGQGDMFEVGKLFSLQREVFAQVQSILEIEKYLPYMSPDEMRTYEQAVMSAKMPDFSPDTIEKWREQANARAKEIDDKFSDAIAKSDEICRQKQANK